MSNQNPIVPSDVVRAIQESVQVEAVTISGRSYATRPVYLPPEEPIAEAIRVNTLTGLIDYVNHEHSLDTAFVHVVSPTQVSVIGGLEGRHQQRTTYAIASCKDIIGNGFSFGSYQNLEQFIVNLQAQFEPTDLRSAVLRVVGNIRQEGVKTLTDDGVTQQVVASAGVARVANVDVPNPVQLRPYRTFPEVAQPESDFVLRLRQGAKDGELPTAALFEADGGAWKLQAISLIRDYLAAQLDGFTIVA